MKNKNRTVLPKKWLQVNKKAIPMGVAFLLICVAALVVIGTIYGSGKKSEVERRKQMEVKAFHNELFGEKVFIFSPEDSVEEVNRVLKNMFKEQETNQFGTNRYAVYFMPGEYDPAISVMVGYYMEVCGLGKSPTDTSISRLNCNATWLGDETNHNACCNFWRGVSNVTITTDTMWAVSQATYMRNVLIDGNLDLHDNFGWASGGFLANSKINGVVNSGSQQQWLSRNCDWNLWTGKNWNMVFVGLAEQDAPEGTWPGMPYTTVAETKIIAEKPYLYCDEKNDFYVYVPKVRENTKSIQWGKDGSSIKIEDFYIAKPDVDTAASINKALEKGKHLLLTPGIYQLEDCIQIKNDETIVLGVGFATLVPKEGNECMKITAKRGVRVAGVLFDAGPMESEALLTVGSSETESVMEEINPLDAICLSDVFFRVGGTGGYVAKTKNCLQIYSDQVIGDNLWVWRADHGEEVAWEKNTAENGVVVDGDDVTIYALMVEHFQEYQTIWNGERGSVYFYQSELPYDVPKQESWMSHDGNVNGFASYKVGDKVKMHEAFGVGIYSYHRDAKIDLFSAMEVPDTEGVRIQNTCAIMITGNPGISHVINDKGDACKMPGDRKIIVEYVNGIQK